MIQRLLQAHLQLRWKWVSPDTHLAVVVKTDGIPFWLVGDSPPISEPILVGIGMFTGGYGILTHGHLFAVGWPGPREVQK